VQIYDYSRVSRHFLVVNKKVLFFGQHVMETDAALAIAAASFFELVISTKEKA
jgi:hypothetical protein